MASHVNLHNSDVPEDVKAAIQLDTENQVRLEMRKRLVLEVESFDLLIALFWLYFCIFAYHPPNFILNNCLRFCIGVF